MSTNIYSIVLLIALASLTIPMANASEQTQISLTSVGNTLIDLVSEEKDRVIRTWIEFSNFVPSDGFYYMQIVQLETGKVVSENTIGVLTTSQKPAINFNNFVLYVVNAEDICQNENFDPKNSSWQDCNPLTGDYEMQISTKDGLVLKSTEFTIIDTRI